MEIDCHTMQSDMALAARRLSRYSLTLARTRTIPSLIVCCEPHSVAAVDTLMEMVVRIVRLIIGVVTTEFEEENEITRLNLIESSIFKLDTSMSEGWNETV